MEKMHVIIPCVLLFIVALLITDGVSVANTLNTNKAAQEQSVTIPYRDSDTFSGENLARLALAIVIGASLVVLAIWGINKIQHTLPGENRKTKQIRLIETRRINQKLTLMVIEVGNKIYVLGQNGENIVRIDAYDAKLSENEDA